MRIEILSIPHEHQRYNTVGDWQMDADRMFITVSHSTEDYDFLVGIHEAIEAYLCRKRNIEEQRVTLFDMKFETNRKPGNADEPGDDPNAPYHREHFFATSIERLIAGELGVDWIEYSHAIESFITKERHDVAS